MGTREAGQEINSELMLSEGFMAGSLGVPWKGCSDPGTGSRGAWLPTSSLFVPCQPTRCTARLLSPAPVRGSQSSAGALSC